MSLKFIQIFMTMITLLLSGCATKSTEPSYCVELSNNDGTITYAESQITRLKCAYGSTFGPDGKCISPQRGTSIKWREAMLAASTYTGIDKKTKDWRIPTKNDMEQVGKCLNKNARIWTSERAVTDDGAIVYENGLYYENSAKDEIHNLGMFVRGGNETSQKQFVAMIKNKIEPDIRRELAEVEKFYADRAIARQESEKLADAREREKLRREMKVIEESPKGTTINCTTNDVVPVNISINQIVFNCPLLGDARTDFLQKYRWKVTSTERIKVQTGTYNMDSYGTRNWNGNGVVISIMLEKF